MPKKDTLRTCGFLLLALLLCGAECTETKVSTKIDTEQKVSETRGNFGGKLSIGDRFGSAIANIGDLEGDGVTDLAVGAPFANDNGADRGVVWILFMDDDGKVDQEQKISEDAGNFDGNLSNDDQFGSAVASIGDLNNDGVFDLAVGAPMDDDGGLNRGAVWILFLDIEGKVQQFQKISDDSGGFNGDLTSGDQFGGAIANIGDLNGDGITDLAVGVGQDNDGGIGKGAVWILFMNTDGTVNSTQKISEDEGNFEGNLHINDHFGSAVAGIGDLNGDGVQDLAVGANLDDDGGTDRGAIWILFMNTNGTVDDHKKISQGNADFEGTLGDDDQFGSSIAALGDLNEDGITDLVVGARQNDNGGADRGAIWLLFMDENGKVKSEARISDTAGNFDGTLSDKDQFGSAVSGIGDLNNDGIADIVSGAPLDNDGGSDKGAFWVLFTERKEIEEATGFNLFGQ